MMHKRIFGPQIGAGTESLYRSQYSHRDNPLWITTNPDPCFYWRWQGTTGLFFLLAEFTARYSQCWELSETLSLKPQAYLIKTYIAYIRQNMQQNLNSWCISKSSGLILQLADVAPCSVVAVMIHHEFNAKHFFFWAWNPRSRHSTTHICSKCITFWAGLVPVTGPHLFEHNFLKAVVRTQLEGSCKVYVGKTVLKTSWNLQPCKGEVGSIEETLQITPPAACLKGHSCEKCLSNYVQDFDLKMQTHFQASWLFFSNEISLLQHHMGLGMIVDPINTRKAKDGA